MKSAAPLIALILLAESAGTAFAEPMRRAHRPWLMIGREPVTETVQPKIATRSVAPKPEVTMARAKSSDPRGSAVAKQALRYKGTRYKFGGNTKKGVDCSGLVARVFEDLKLKKVPRASAALYNAGSPVRLSELRPGDLVFFKNTYKRGISHVGVYTGNNKFVHASNRRRGVTVTPLSDPYYQLHYAGARRLY
jgi:cell wall-associated NlpC family hydrolase